MNLFVGVYAFCFFFTSIRYKRKGAYCDFLRYAGTQETDVNLLVGVYAFCYFLTSISCRRKGASYDFLRYAGAQEIAVYMPFAIVFMEFYRP